MPPPSVLIEIRRSSRRDRSDRDTAPDVARPHFRHAGHPAAPVGQGGGQRRSNKMVARFASMFIMQTGHCGTDHLSARPPLPSHSKNAVADTPIRQPTGSSNGTGMNNALPQSAMLQQDPQPVTAFNSNRGAQEDATPVPVRRRRRHYLSHSPAQTRQPTGSCGKDWVTTGAAENTADTPPLVITDKDQ